MENEGKIKELEERVEKLERPSREDELDKLLWELDRKGFNTNTRTITLEITSKEYAYLSNEENKELLTLLKSFLEDTNLKIQSWNPLNFYSLVTLYQEEEEQ